MPIDNTIPTRPAHPLPADATTRMTVGGVDVSRITYQGEPVITLTEIDRLHHRNDDTAARALRENRERFVDGVDVIVPTSLAIRGMCEAGILPERTARVTFLTRRGYLKIVKVLSDDRAWDVQGEMIERFFAFEQAAPALAFDPGDPKHVLALVGHYSAQIAAKDERIAELEPKARDLDRLAGAKGSIAFRYAANTLGIRPKDLDVWMSVNDWTYRTAGNQVRAHTDKITAGFLEHSLLAVGPDKGILKTNVLVTAAGMVELVRLIDPAQFVKTKKPRKRTKKVTGPSEDGAILIDLEGEAA